MQVPRDAGRGMIGTLGITGTVFAPIALGYVAGRAGVLGSEGVAALGA